MATALVRPELDSTERSKKYSSRSAESPRPRLAKRLAERNALVEEHVAWARSIAANIARTLPPCFTADDLVGVAEIALIRIAERWDASRGIPFRAYAGRRIAGACRDISRRRYLTEAMGEALEDLYHDPEPTIEEALVQHVRNRGMLSTITTTLPAELHGIVRRLYFEGLSITEVAREMGLSPAKASQLHQAALSALREAFTA